MPGGPSITGPSDAHNVSPNIFSRTFTSIILYRDFRLFWMGSWTEHLGEWMETAALLWLLNEMTRSPFLGTLMVTLRFLPLVVFALLGGIVADRINRRDLLVYALLASALLSISLAVVVYVGLAQPWHLLLYSGISGIITGFNHPARFTLMPNLIDRKHFFNGVVLDNASVMVSRVIGMPLAGFIIGFAGTTPVLGLRAAGALLAIVWLRLIRAPTTPPEARKKTPVKNFVEGLQYVAHRRTVLTHVLLFLIPMFLTNTYTGLLPFFATDYLYVGPELYGILSAAPGAGSLLAILGVASAGDFKRKETLLLVGGLLQGVGMILFAFSFSFLPALLVLVLVGGASALFSALNNTIIQQTISDQMRGRVMALREAIHGLGPAGSLASGAVAAVLGVPVAMIGAGGVSVLILLAIMFALPKARRRS